MPDDQTTDKPPVFGRSSTSSQAGLIHLEPGARVVMQNGSERTVVENPNDGVWILLDDGSASGEMVGIGDVKERVNE